MINQAHDVAAYILSRQGEMTTMKLQKLVYYSQAWSLVWDEEPIFQEQIEAWANGPVVSTLYGKHRGQFKVSHWSEGDPEALTSTQKETIDAVLRFYGPKSSQWLGDLARREAPWIEARQDGRGSHEISHAAMAEYYGSLDG